MRRSLLALTAALVPWSATAAPDRGPAIGIAKFWFVGDKKLGCVNPNGDPIMCKITEDTNFHVYYSPDRKHALVVVDYLPDATGNAARSVAVTAEEVGEVEEWEVTRHLYDISGQEPGKIKFSARKVSFVMKERKPTDARCCPTGRKTYSLPLSH